MLHALKISYEGEVRRVSVENISYSYLKATAKSLFGLQDGQFTICWQDDEDDNINVASEEEV